MALTFLGSKVEIADGDLPAAYVKPVISPTFKGAGWTKKYNLTVAKAAVQNSDPAVTFDNIMTDGTVGVNKQLEDLVTAELITTGAVEGYGVIRSVKTNQIFGDDLYNDTTVFYRIEAVVITDA